MSRRPKYPPEIEKRASRIRGVGYLIFGAGTLLITSSILTGAISGVSNDQARDPFSGHKTTELESSCERMAEVLAIGLEKDGESSDWTVFAQGFQLRCPHIDTSEAETIREALYERDGSE